MITRSLVFIAVILGATAAAAKMPSAEHIAKAERAFAAEAAKSGWIAAFKLYSAPEAIMLSPDPVNAKTTLDATPADHDGKDLNWWPIWAGIAKSGDLGFTTGPYTAGADAFGNYFTVWRRQADGSWKWIFDGGPRSAERSAFGPETPTAYLEASSGGAGTADAAKTEVAAVEAELAQAAKTDAKAAYLPYFAEDARMMGSPSPPATAAAEREAELARRGATIEFASLGSEGSAAGDLVFTYGDAKWTKDGVERRGHYARIWQKRSEGWKLVFDEILPVPVKKN